jgi:hypothetical protein
MRVAPWSAPDLPRDATLALYRVDLEVAWGDPRAPRAAHYITLRAIDAGKNAMRGAP